jgi:hypothetical protein
MEMSNIRELSLLVAITADDTSAITENSDDTSVLPVGLTLFIGKLHNSQ